MTTYRLYVKAGEQWEMACTVVAADPQSALKEAVSLLKPEHRDKPMKLEAEAPPPGIGKPPGK